MVQTKIQRYKCTNARKYRNKQKVYGKSTTKPRKNSIKRTNDIKDCANNTWRQINHVVTNSANQVLGMEKKQRKQVWFNELCDDTTTKEMNGEKWYYKT